MNMKMAICWSRTWDLEKTLRNSSQKEASLSALWFQSFSLWSCDIPHSCRFSHSVVTPSKLIHSMSHLRWLSKVSYPILDPTKLARSHLSISCPSACSLDRFWCSPAPPCFVWVWRIGEHSLTTVSIQSFLIRALSLLPIFVTYSHKQQQCSGKHLAPCTKYSDEEYPALKLIPWSQILFLRKMRKSGCWISLSMDFGPLILSSIIFRKLEMNKQTHVCSYLELESWCL